MERSVEVGIREVLLCVACHRFRSGRNGPEVMEARPVVESGGSALLRHRTKMLLDFALAHSLTVSFTHWLTSSLVY